MINPPSDGEFSRYRFQLAENWSVVAPHSSSKRYQKKADCVERRFAYRQESRGERSGSTTESRSNNSIVECIAAFPGISSSTPVFCTGDIP